MQSQAFLDTDLVRTLADLVTRTDLSEIVVERGDFRIRVARSATRSPLRMPDATRQIHPSADLADAGPGPESVTSPMVGTIRLRAVGTGEIRAGEGAGVEAGDVLLVIEAMKTYTEVLAPRGGTVAAVHVRDGQPVEFGQPLLTLA